MNMPIIHGGHDQLPPRARRREMRGRAAQIVRRIPAWVVILLVIFIGLSAWSALTRAGWDSRSMEGGGTAISDPSSPSDPALGAARDIAVIYETGIQTGKPDVVCPLEVDEASCRHVYGGSFLPNNTLTKPVTVVQTAAVTTAVNAQGTAVSGVGVLVEWQAQGQSVLRSAILIADKKVVRRVTIGSANAGADLATLLGEQVK